MHIVRHRAAIARPEEETSLRQQSPGRQSMVPKAEMIELLSRAAWQIRNMNRLRPEAH